LERQEIGRKSLRTLMNLPSFLMREKTSLQKEMFLKNYPSFVVINATCGIVKKNCRLFGILLKLTFDDYDDEKFDVIFFLYWKKITLFTLLHYCNYNTNYIIVCEKVGSYTIIVTLFSYYLPSDKISFSNRQVLLPYSVSIIC